MPNWAGRCNFIFTIFVLVMVFTPSYSAAQSRDLALAKATSSNTRTWADVRESMQKQDAENYKKGLSYIVSGTSALIAGFLGERASADPIDKAIYSTFQVIGTASIGYGAYKWKIEDEEKLFYNSLETSKNLKPEDKVAVMENYYLQKKERERKERVIKALTHTLVAGLNLYGASVQTNNNIRNGLYFLAGVNVLAAVSFTF